MGAFLAKTEATHRNLHLQRHLNKQMGSNKVETTKYSWWSFLPKAILLQFIRPANLVYLISAVLQSVREISSLSPVTAIAPFVFVIGISLIREGYEDYKRYRKDKQINERKTQVLLEGEFWTISWEEVLVGDIIKVTNNQTIPADFLLLYTSEEHSLCYVETANLDGESNLKAKFALVEDIKLPPEQFNSLAGTMQVDAPNSILHQFSGRITLTGFPSKQANVDNFLLRETVLKNTAEVLGVVVYTGYDTKIIQNQGNIENKVSHVQRKVNVIQGFLLVVLFLMSASCSIGYHLYHNVNHRRQYLSHLHPQVTSRSLQVGLIFLSSFLLLTYLIPISLNVSIEVIKGFLGIFLSFDSKMYYEPIEKGCNANNISILEQLGQVDYVLTDKTGTLTANEMVFKHLSLGNSNYSAQQILTNCEVLRQNPKFHHFWMGLIICQDVVYNSEYDEYQGSSPDEVCFVTYARKIGYQFVRRTKNTLEFKIFGKEVSYQLLGILPFSSRKRMSVIVRDQGKGDVVVYTKGADSCIFSNALPFEEEDGMEKSIDRFARQGYRTLVFSYRRISYELYQKFKLEENQLRIEKNKKSVPLAELQKKQAELINQMQSNLLLLGATAIEDRLQDNVPETIERLQQAGIIVMMITGDKLETAENIGLLAKFIKQDSRVFRFQAGLSQEQITDQARLVLAEKESIGPISVIIEGSAISLVINSQLDIYAEMLNTVSSVIFCRSSPKEKAMIVTYVKEKLKGIVLAIGDGGNDVGMIQVANIGVGILGKEGNSASAASDFSIGQFRFLDRLVLHHGRWFYYRLSYFFVYYGWKNLILTMLLYFFMVESVFSAFPALSEPFLAVYNIVIGLVLVVYFAVFEQDINDDQHPSVYAQLPLFYKQVKNSNLFSYKRYIVWSFFGFGIAVFVFISSRFGLGTYYAIDGQGHVGSFSHQASVLAMSLSFIIIMVLISDIKHYTLVSGVLVVGVITVLGTMAFFVLENFTEIGVARNYHILQMSTFRFWQVVFLNGGTAYAGKMLIDTLQREIWGETAVEQEIRRTREMPITDQTEVFLKS